MRYMFRTILVHHQEQIYKLYIAFGICRYHTSGCCVAIAYKVAPEDELTEFETCRTVNEK